MGIAGPDGERRLKTLGLINRHPMASALHTDGESVHLSKPRSCLIITNKIISALQNRLSSLT